MSQVHNLLLITVYISQHSGNFEGPKKIVISIFPILKAKVVFSAIKT
jgi:hypothetical protein